MLVALASGIGMARADVLADVQSLAGAGNLSGALAAADKAIADQPRDARLRFLRGVLLMDLKREAEAIAAFRQMNADYPELADPLNNLGVIYAGQGRMDEARAALESALRNDPKHRAARANLADVYVHLALRLWEGLLADGAPTPADAAIARKLRLGRELMHASE